MRFKKILLLVALLLLAVGLTGGVSIGLSSQQEIDLEKGLVAYWKFDEGEGDIAFDETDNHNDGMLMCASDECSPPKWVKGKIRYALEFDGVDDYVDLGDDASLDMGKDDFTIVAWIQPAVSHQGSIYSNVRSGGAPGMEIALDGDFIRFEGGDVFSIPDSETKFVTPSNSIAINVWSHIAVVRENMGNEKQLMQIYINKVESGNNTDILRDMNSNDNDYIGEFRSDLRHFNGIIDEVRIYSRGLSKEEIEQLYAAGME